MEIKNQYVNWSVLVVSTFLFVCLIVAESNERVAKDNVIRVLIKIHQST